MEKEEDKKPRLEGFKIVGKIELEKKKNLSQKEPLDKAPENITFNATTKPEVEKPGRLDNIEDLKKNKIEILNSLEPYFDKSENSILEAFKIQNSIDNMLLEGEYIRAKKEGKLLNFGFLESISDRNQKILTYPITNERVVNIFIFSGALIEGKRYCFEASLAQYDKRRENSNPFLLQAKPTTVKEIIEISDLSAELKQKQAMIQDVNILLNASVQEIQDKKKKLSTITESLDKTNYDLSKMENLIATLRDRISLCKNLQFISAEDENRYLNLLSPKEFTAANHLDFETDFDKSFSRLSDHIHSYLYHQENLIYTRFQIRNFLTLLKTHDIIVLSGLSGSGKTQIVKAFAKALGGVAKIIPVKPNWTSSDDLIGYYNPLQMSFLPTPFTEAIVEAIHNPNQLYLICLDEMNLARVEYYFADFLSKLEERNKQPEIELYANHEEELFVSEFSTLLNLIESSIKGKAIKSWQEFLDNEEARKRFFEMLGNTDKESMLQLHAKMKRRLIDILKFPSTIRVPDNVRFIGAINVDETTHYFSPKILDRIHIVKFENPLLFEDQVNTWFENTKSEKELKPVYVSPTLFSIRKGFPTVNNSELTSITKKLKEINQRFLLPLNIDFGIRSIRQALNYCELNKASYDKGDVFDISLNSIVLQKIFPRFSFDGSETTKNGKSKLEITEEFQTFLTDEFSGFYARYETDETGIGKASHEYLADMIDQAKRNSNSQFNFFA